MSRIYVLDGACLSCTLGTTEGKLKVTSQSKVYIHGKLKATDADHTVLPTFGNCKRNMGWPTPCQPNLQKWTNTSRKVTLGDKTFVMDDSINSCSYGGLIFVKDHLQPEGGVLVGTGRAVKKTDGDKAPFQGYIIFVNGNIVDLVNKTNALTGFVPERDHAAHYQYEGAEPDESPGQWNSSSDRYSGKEALNDLQRQAGWRHHAYVALFGVWQVIKDYQSTDRYKQFIGYWDQDSNGHQFIKKHAEYFDALGNEHFINGSHGLGSKAHHRMDHGAVQGEAWARKNLPFFSKKLFEKNKDICPGLHEPKNVPITIVMHSQGNAMGLGVVKGIGKYMSELGWDKIALNLVCLSVNQSMALTGKELDRFTSIKTGMMAPNYILNSLAHLFTDKRILNSPVGIEEYASIGLNGSKPADNIPKFFPNWETIKKHGVQFTFSNDRSDVVMRMGDLPGMESACGPNTKRNLTGFEITGSTYTMPPFFLDNLYKYGDLKDGVIRKDTFITKYRDLVETFMIKYNTYHNDLEYFKKFPKQRLEAKHLQYTTIMVDKMEYPMEELKDAYGDLWNAEVSVHSAPVAWNDQKNMISDKSQSIFDFIKERGHSIFYRKTNQSPNLLAIAAIYKK